MRKFALLIFVLYLLVINNAYPQNGENENQMINKHHLNDTVVLVGSINKGMSLSRTTGSDLEYFNDSYNLNLKNPIEILEAENANVLFNDISTVEIINPYEHEMTNYYGQEFVIEGIINVFKPQQNTYRQYSTPVYIQVISLKPKD